MPRISFFYGITITMYWNERDHPAPHFHAEYAGREASVSVNGTLLGGSLPPRAMRLVRAWAALHEDELTRNWARARRLQALDQIDPLP